jgi:hypothetical protein
LDVVASKLPIIVGLCGTPNPGEYADAVFPALSELFAALQPQVANSPVWLLITGENQLSNLAIKAFRETFRDGTSHRVVLVCLKSDPRNYGLGIDRLLTEGDSAAHVNATLARLSHTVIAVIDEREMRTRSAVEPGHPAPILRYRRRGVPVDQAPGNPLNLPELGEVVTFTLPVTKTGARTTTGIVVRRRYPPHWGKTATNLHDAVLEGVEQFNREVNELIDSNPSALQRSWGSLVNWDALSDTEKSLVQNSEAQELAGTHAASDALAIAYARKMFLSLCVLFTLALFAITFNQLYGAYPDQYWRLYTYGVLILCGVAAAWWVKNRSFYQEKFLQYRALAEATRVLFFWRLCAVDESVADAYFPSHTEEGDWISKSLRFLDARVRLSRSDAYTASPMVAFGLAQREWVQGQLQYFFGAPARGSLGAIRRNTIRHQRTAGLAPIAGLAGALVLVAMVIAHWSPFDNRVLQRFSLSGSHVRAWGLIASSLCLAIGALAAGFGRLMGYQEHASRYRRVGIRFDTARNRLAEAIRTRKWAEARGILGAVGRVALEENESWFSVGRERPSDFPV